MKAEQAIGERRFSSPPDPTDEIGNPFVEHRTRQALGPKMLSRLLVEPGDLIEGLRAMTFHDIRHEVLAAVAPLEDGVDRVHWCERAGVQHHGDPMKVKYGALGNRPLRGQQDRSHRDGRRSEFQAPREAPGSGWDLQVTATLNNAIPEGATTFLVQ